MRVVAKIVVVAVVAVGLTGCGSDPAATAGLLDRLAPLDPPSAAVVDVARLRESLDVGTVSFTDAIVSPEANRQRFGNAVAVGFPLLRAPSRSPLLDAVDAARVTAVATNSVTANRRAVTLIATDQPFNEVADALVRAGYTRTGNLLRAPAGTTPAQSQAVAGGDGVIAVGTELDTVKVAAEGTGGGVRGLVRTLLDEQDAPAAAAMQSPSTCPRAVVVADDPAERRGVVTVLDDTARAARFVAGRGTLFRALSFGEPKVDGGRLTVAVTYPDGPVAVQPAQMLRGEAPLEAIYNCER